MTRFQKTATIIALALCFGVAVAGELREASHSPYPPQQFGNSKTTSAPQNKAAQEKPEEAIARYNFWLTIVTTILAIATVGLGGIGIFQIRLARAEFISTHRPKNPH